MQVLLSGGRPQITLTNIVTNGNFADTTGWTNTGANLSAANNTLTVTGAGTSAAPRAIQATSSALSAGKKYYVRAEFLVTNSVAVSVSIRATGTTSGSTTMVAYQTYPTADTVYTISDIFTQTNQVGDLSFQLWHSYADTATANGKVMQVQEAMAIDLTSIFGAGSEPTKAQMDRWLEIFSAGWFASTKAIPKRIY